jgi:hypothetical protein
MVNIGGGLVRGPKFEGMDCRYISERKVGKWSKGEFHHAGTKYPKHTKPE